MLAVLLRVSRLLALLQKYIFKSYFLISSFPVLSRMSMKCERRGSHAVSFNGKIIFKKHLL